MNFLKEKQQKSSLKIRTQVGSMVGSVANIILDPIFIFGLKQGAAGAAIATVLGNLIADIYYVCVMIKKLTDCQCQLAMQRFRLQWLETFLL